MPTKRQRRTRKRSGPDIVQAYWRGDPPPDVLPTKETSDLFIGACFFGEGKPEEPLPWSHEHHPHAREWFEWHDQLKTPD